VSARLVASLALLLSLTIPASAHRLDEYLQATLISVESDRIVVEMRLVPGVAVSPEVLAHIDVNGDGKFSEAEQQAYALHVLRDLSLTVDGKRADLELVAHKFPSPTEIKEGLGEIRMDFTAHLPAGGAERRVIFENHHLSRISVYLANCLVPRNPTIRVLRQSRNQNQSFYQLDYTAAANASPASSGWSDAVGFGSIFRLGMRHIAEGTDHLLFLLALLLPAPLLAVGTRWGGGAGARHGLRQILRVVTAFTLGHSLTLGLAAWRVVIVPSRIIEGLIAVSILVSAIHAMRPIFPGKEAVIAASFGLIHGLAFAATLGELGLSRWQRVAGIFAFNLGIETMQLMVVAATMPSLVLLSRTRAYGILRIAGALFAALASLGWIAERWLNLHNPVDALVAVVAHYAWPIAGGLFAFALVCTGVRAGSTNAAIRAADINAAA
jgi:hypothetical protein